MGRKIAKNRLETWNDVPLARAATERAQSPLVKLGSGCLVVDVMRQAPVMNAVAAELGKPPRRRNDDGADMLVQAVARYRRRIVRQARHHATRAALYASLGSRGDALREVELCRLRLDQASMTDGELLRLFGDGGAR